MYTQARKASNGICNTVFATNYCKSIIYIYPSRTHKKVNYWGIRKLGNKLRDKIFEIRKFHCYVKKTKWMAVKPHRFDHSIGYTACS